MSFDVPLTGKAALIALVIVIGTFFAIFAPSLIAIAAIFVFLAAIAYVIWIVAVRINTRMTGRRYR